MTSPHTLIDEADLTPEESISQFNSSEQLPNIRTEGAGAINNNNMNFTFTKLDNQESEQDPAFSSPYINNENINQNANVATATCINIAQQKITSPHTSIGKADVTVEETCSQFNSPQTPQLRSWRNTK